MKTIAYNAKFVEKASRWELLVRFIWAIPTYVVLVILEVVGGICAILQFLHILVFGKRHEMMQRGVQLFVSYYAKFASYLLMLTDERSPILPEE